MIFSKLVKDIRSESGVVTVEMASGETHVFNVFSDKIESSGITGKSMVSMNNEEPEVYGQYSVNQDGSVRFKGISDVIPVKDNRLEGGLSVPEYDPNKTYLLNEVFSFNGVPVYSNVNDQQVSIDNSESIGASSIVPLSMYAENVCSDGNKLSISSGSYTQIARYNDDGTISMSIENSDSTGQVQHIIGDVFFSIADGVVKHGDTEVLENVRAYTKYRNNILVLIGETVYAYRIGSYDRYVWRNKINLLDGIDGDVSLSYGSRTITVFIRDNSTVIVKRFGTEKTVYLPSTVSSFAMLKDKNKSLFTSDGDVFLIDIIMSDVVAVDDDFFYGNFQCPSLVEMSYTFNESPSDVIENYGYTYRDLNGNNVKSIAVIGDVVYGETGDVVQRILTTSGSIMSIENTMTGTSQSIQGGISSIFSIGESLYVLSAGYVKKINTDTLEIDTTIDITSNISGTPIRVGTGPMGIAVLTDNGTIGIYSNIYAVPDKIASISAYSDSSYIAPVSTNGIWVSDSSGSDNNAYNVLFETGLTDGQIRLKAFGTISMTQIGSAMYALESSNGSTSLKKYNSHITVDMI